MRKVLKVRTFLNNIPFGAVVQLVRMLPCHGRGRGFESRPVRHLG